MSIHTPTLTYPVVGNDKTGALSDLADHRGPAAAGVAAVEVAVDHLLDNGTEEPVLFLKAALILCQEPVEVVKEHLVKDGSLGMTGAIDPCHSGEEHPENKPEERMDSSSPGNGRRRQAQSIKNRQQKLPKDHHRDYLG